MSVINIIKVRARCCPAASKCIAYGLTFDIPRAGWHLEMRESLTELIVVCPFCTTPMEQLSPETGEKLVGTRAMAKALDDG